MDQKNRLIIAIAVTGWIGMARLFRGQVFSLKESEFVLASRTMGAGSLWIILKHLLPNAMSPIIISMANVIPSAIFSEAFLSYASRCRLQAGAFWQVTVRTSS